MEDLKIMKYEQLLSSVFLCFHGHFFLQFSVCTQKLLNKKEIEKLKTTQGF